MRKFLRFSVRGMIVVVLLIGAGIGWIVRGARGQRDAVAAIENSNGLAAYDGKWIIGIHDPASKTWAPRWLVDRIGIDYFSRVTFVAIDEFTMRVEPTHPRVASVASGQEASTRKRIRADGVLARFKELPDLSVLHLNGHQVTDAGLVHLKGLTKLSVLDLQGTQVTDAGMVHLQGLTNLSELDLRDTRVTDAGVKELQQALPNLTIER